MAAICGIEQEFYATRAGEQLDFREIVHTLGVPGARNDPADRNAYRLADGTLITADGTEAEFATVPLDTVAGFGSGLAGLSTRLYGNLRALVPDDIELRGAATHINVSAPSNMADDLVLRYGLTFGAALQALWDRPWGEGLMIRPRPGRVEFGGEFLAGPRLVVTALFCVASLEALAARAKSVPQLKARPRPHADRLGIEWRRDTFAPDLYGPGRRASVTLSDGRSLRFDRYLEQAWKACRPFAAAHATRHELRVVDAIVKGKLPLGIEGGPLGALREGLAVQTAFVATPLGRYRLGDGSTVEAVFDTWDYSVFRCRGRDEWFLSVPRDAMAEFRDRLANGDLGTLAALPRLALTRHAQVRRLTAFGRIDDVSLVRPIERPPESGFLRPFANASGSEGSSAASTAAPAPRSALSGGTLPQREERPGKWGLPPPLVVPPPEGPGAVPPPEQTTAGVPVHEGGGRGIPRWLVALIFIALTGIAIGTVVALSGGDNPAQPAGGAAGPSPQASLEATAGGFAPGPTPSPSATAGSAGPSPAVQPSATSGASADPSPSATTATQPAPSATVGTAPSPAPTVAQPSPSVVATEPPPPSPSPPPPPPVITTQVQFKQIISSVSGNCGGQPPEAGTDLSLPTPTTVVIDWANHTIQIGDSLVSPFNPETGFASVTWGTGDQRRSDVIITPEGLAGTSSFFPFWNIPQGATCQIMLTTTASVVPGQPLLFP